MLYYIIYPSKVSLISYGINTFVNTLSTTTYSSFQALFVDHLQPLPHKHCVNVGHRCEPALPSPLHCSGVAIRYPIP